MANEINQTENFVKALERYSDDPLTVIKDEGS